MLKIRLSTGKDPDDWMNVIKMGKREGGKTRKKKGKETWKKKQTKKRGEGKQIRKTQDEPQWIVAQRLLSALTIPRFS